MFTFLPLSKIGEIMKEQNNDPSKRVAQHALAREFVELAHGPLEAQAVALQHLHLFRPRSSTAQPTPAPATPQVPANYARSPMAGFWNPQSGNRHAPQTNFANLGAPRVILPKSLVYNQHFHKVLYSAGLVSSKSEGHRILAKASAYVGSRPGDSGQMSDDLAFTPIHVWPAEKTQQYILDGNLLILKLGKWKMKIVNIISDEEFRERGLSAPGWDELEKSRVL
jgi:tyrosyl-tRNA synthetase